MEAKERILTKAAELFMRYGIRSITMDEIATQLGISKKTIYQFFTDKDEMVQAVIDLEIGRSESDCLKVRETALDAIQEIFLGQELLEEMLKYMNPLIMYDLEKHHPRAFKKLREYKYEFIYNMTISNLQWGIEQGIYRNEVNLDVTAKWRIESAFSVFDQDIFPHTRYKLSQVNFDLSMLFLHAVASDEGKTLIEKYTKERNKKMSHEQV